MNNADAAPNQRILIIDDNPAIHEDFRKILCSAANSRPAVKRLAAALFDDAPPAAQTISFELDLAHQGQEGLERAKQALAENRPYALAFVDVRMPPGLDGVETTARIWALDPDIQIVICTAYSDYAWEDLFAKLGKTDGFVILKKPFENIEVLQLAHCLTRKWGLLKESKAKLASTEELVATRSAQLFQEQEKFKAIFDNSPEGIFQTSVDGRFLSANPALAAICGYASPQDLMEQVTEPHNQLYVDGVRWAEFRRRLREEGAVGDFEMEIKCKGGSKKWVNQTACTVTQPGDADSYFQGFMVDVTGQREARQERDLMEAHLHDTHRLESVGRLASGLAHEINNPLQCIGGNVDFVEESFRELIASLVERPPPVVGGRAGISSRADGERAGPVHEADDLAKEIPVALGQARHGVERVARIVRALGDFSARPEAGKIATNLSQVIETTLTVSRSEWQEVADVVTDFAPDLPPVPCLPGELGQAILNVIVNAAQAISDATGAARPANGAKGTLRISTGRKGSLAEIRVSDTGLGISEPIRSRVFDPFFTTKEVGRGTGLGLTVARSIIVNKHGGQFTFETLVGQGTTFIIGLPLGPDSPPDLI